MTASRSSLGPLRAAASSLGASAPPPQRRFVSDADVIAVKDDFIALAAARGVGGDSFLDVMSKAVESYQAYASGCGGDAAPLSTFLTYKVWVATHRACTFPVWLELRAQAQEVAAAPASPAAGGVAIKREARPTPTKSVASPLHKQTKRRSRRDADFVNLVTPDGSPVAGVQPQTPPRPRVLPFPSLDGLPDAGGALPFTSPGPDAGGAVPFTSPGPGEMIDHATGIDFGRPAPRGDSWSSASSASTAGAATSNHSAYPGDARPNNGSSPSILASDHNTPPTHTEPPPTSHTLPLQTPPTHT